MIATKFLISDELAAYYSSAPQAAAGERDALALKHSRLRVEAESEPLS